MPSLYAHYRFGQEVRGALKNREKRIVETYPELFLIGLHGPDILFYYHPLTSNFVNQTGYDMHDKAGREFFEYAAKVVRKYSNHGAYLSYVYGFICHFALDKACHGYIDEKIAESGVSHAEIETEFDRALMVKDGFNPIRHRLTKHITPSMRNARVISCFYKGITARQVRTALREMIISHSLLRAPSKTKRKVINSVLKASGYYDSIHGMVVNIRKNPKCDDSTETLSTLYQEAKREAVRLIQEYKGYVEENKPLDSVYCYTFGSKLVEEGEKKNGK